MFDFSLKIAEILVITETVIGYFKLSLKKVYAQTSGIYSFIISLLGNSNSTSNNKHLVITIIVYF